LAIAVGCVLSTSFVIIDKDKVGHLNRKFMAKPLPEGRILALSGELGPQARVLGPGFRFEFLLNVFYDVESLPVLEIPTGKYAILKAKDGNPLRQGQYLADAWPEEDFDLMKNAEYFMGEAIFGKERSSGPRGQKGPQLSVLRPGTERINRYLFDVTFGDALVVEAGEVAVIKSNVQEIEDCQPKDILKDQQGVLSVPLVPKSCVGIWEDPIYPGTHYMNELAYTWTKISTRVQAWEYKGGYTKRQIDLDVDQDGKITQKVSSDEILVPEGAADGAVACRVEGWTVPQELRVLVQIDPRDAAFVVASVGNIQEVENKIVTPAIRSVVRTVVGRAVRGTEKENSELEKLSEEDRALILGTRVLDLVEKRESLENSIEEALKPEARKAKVTIKDIRLAEPAIPPELLVAKLRAQLADQLIAAYKKERKAQEDRQLVKKAQEQADRQDMLVKADFDAKAMERKKDEMRSQGEGEKLRDIEKAQGQKALVSVLGEDRVLQLEMFKLALDAAIQNPDIVKTPHVLVNGEAGATGLAGAAAVLGNSTLIKGIQGAKIEK
jgi:hypothetical protein